MSLICCFVCPLFFAAPSFVTHAVVRQNAQGNFTTTTQAPALPMLRGTSYRKTERLAASLSCKDAFLKNPVLLHADKKVKGSRLKRKQKRKKEANAKKKSSYKILICFSHFRFNWSPDWFLQNTCSIVYIDIEYIWLLCFLQFLFQVDAVTSVHSLFCAS